ncbi:Swc5 [Kluyveromyces lactis]|nr:Swc5 [Kluyveromyces lactis]
MSDTKGSGLNEDSALEFDEESYHESEDEDFDPSKEQSKRKTTNGNKKTDVNANISDSDQGEDEDEEYDEEAQEEEKKYSSIVSESGGLIKTRKARLQEEHDALKNKYEQIDITETSGKSNDLWRQLKERALSRSQFNGSVMDQDASSITDSMQEQKILIERIYKFAGEVIKEKKWVLRQSAEGQEYLNSIKFKTGTLDKNTVPPDTVKNTQAQQTEGKQNRVNEAGRPLKRHLKRPPILEQIIAGNLKPKLTTLEKSQLDWASYVDKEGIHEELNLHNKDGFLAKQDFLNRVESSKDQKYRELRKLQLQTEQQKQ